MEQCKNDAVLSSP